MTIRERLRELSELDIESKLVQMNDFQILEFTDALNAFIDEFPNKETELKKNLADKDYMALSVSLVGVRDMLTGIYATEIAEECQKHINGLISVKHEKVEAYVAYLISVLTMLSIDIQMAVYEGDNDEQPEFEDDETGGIKIAYEPDISKRGILAVDDDSFLLETLKKTFMDTEYKLTAVNSGMAALRFIQKRSPDLFILDIEMPEMDGYELANKIKGYGCKAPIIFLTGNATKDYVLKAMKAGASDFIVKPVTKKQVLERVGKFI